MIGSSTCKKLTKLKKRWIWRTNSTAADHKNLFQALLNGAKTFNSEISLNLWHQLINNWKKLAKYEEDSKSGKKVSIWIGMAKPSTVSHYLNFTCWTGKNIFCERLSLEVKNEFNYNNLKCQKSKGSSGWPAESKAKLFEKSYCSVFDRIWKVCCIMNCWNLMKTVIAEHYSYHHQNLIAAVKEKRLFIG